MLPTDFPRPDALEFASIRADLARLYLAHKETFLPGWGEAEIIARVDDITAALVGCAQVALCRGDHVWLERHRWFKSLGSTMAASRLQIFRIQRCDLGVIGTL